MKKIEFLGFFEPFFGFVPWFINFKKKQDHDVKT
jgi:hypothetical protein